MTPVTICFVIPQNQNKKSKQKSFKLKAVMTSMLSGKLLQARATVHYTTDTLQICNNAYLLCHVM